MKASTHGHKDLMREDRHRVAATLCRAALSAPRADPKGHAKICAVSQNLSIFSLIFVSHMQSGN
jgi:hypothetical protein